MIAVALLLSKDVNFRLWQLYKEAIIFYEERRWVILGGGGRLKSFVIEKNGGLECFQHTRGGGRGLEIL